MVFLSIGYSFRDEPRLLLHCPASSPNAALSFTPGPPAHVPEVHVEPTGLTSLIPEQGYGVIGVFRPKSDLPWHVIYVTQARLALRIEGRDIMEMVDYAVYPPLPSTLKNGPHDASAALAIGNYYFIPEWTLDSLDCSSHSLFHILPNRHTAISSPLLEGSSRVEGKDTSYIWNLHLLAPSQHLSRMGILLYRGYVGTALLPGSPTYRLSLVGNVRFSRPGKRYMCRGLDASGGCANEVESTVIIHPDGRDHDKKRDEGEGEEEEEKRKEKKKEKEKEKEGEMEKENHCDSSHYYTMLRGSLPLLWSQNIKGFQYRPPVGMGPREESLQALERHCSRLLRRWGRVGMMNVLDEHWVGDEAMLSQAYRTAVEEVQRRLGPERGGDQLSYLSHPILREKGSLDGAVEDSWVKEASQYGWTWIEPDGTVKSQQRGVIRVNCLDCVDRSNILQERLSWRHLQRLPLLNLQSDVVERMHRKLWMDQGDALAQGYVGTRAVGRLLVGYGPRRSLWWRWARKWEDAQILLGRRYMNLFLDARRQGWLCALSGRQIETRSTEAEEPQGTTPLFVRLRRRWGPLQVDGWGGWLAGVGWFIGSLILGRWWNRGRGRRAEAREEEKVSLVETTAW